MPVPPNEHAHIDDMSISADGRVLEIAFTGGAPYDPLDPCSVDYTALTWLIDDQLYASMVAVDHPDQVKFRPGQICADVGFRRSTSVTLDMPFGGYLVRDVGGNAFVLRRPPGLIDVDIPSGWALATEGDEPVDGAPLWCRTYQQAEASHDLQLCQALGGPTQIDGKRREAAVVLGEPATLWLTPETGEIILEWMYDGDGMAIIANAPDFTPEQVLALAETTHR